MDNDNPLLQKAADLYRGLRFTMKYRGVDILPAAAGNDLARDLLEGGQPFLFGRCGATEMRTVADWLQNGGHNFTDRTRADIRNLSGVFPTDDATLDKFCRLYVKTAQSAELLALWNVGAEREVIRGCDATRFTELRALEPYYHARPWSAALAGKRVLVVDMDAQGNCTYTLTGARVTDNTFDRAGVYDMFRAYGISGTQNYISRTQFDNIDIIPANGNTPMAAKQLQILEQSESTSINMFLAMCLAQVASEYDFILIDTPPSRDVMVTNALMASDFVLIPCVCDDYSRDSVYRTVAMCQQLEHDEGEKIDVLGIILTMVEKTALTEVIRNELRESQLGSKLFAAEIRKGQAVKDSTRLGAPVVLCARSSNPAKDYAKVYAELKTRVEQEAE